MKPEKSISVCFGADCVDAGAREIEKALIESGEILGGIEVRRTSCLGCCGDGPVIRIESDGTVYGNLSPGTVAAIVSSHLSGKPAAERIRVPSVHAVPNHSEIDFFSMQKLVVLRNRGRIDPDSIDEYIGCDGYQGLVKALDMKPIKILDKIKASGLRGRGGAGFPAGRKWELCRNAKGNPKYLICNADEGDPGAYMDRSLLEGDPHAVIEGMIIGAWTIGAERGFIYVRDEYPLAVARTRRAIEEARACGLLGSNILNSGLNFDLEVVRGGGAFVCGEETALMASIEGREGRPRPRPPYPSEKGLWGCPTNINNVETWANVPPILLHGSEWFASLGTETSKGTKVFSLVGKVNNSGLVEVPMGITLREIVFKIGGGIPGGKKFKAVQTGGPSGGCIPEPLLDLPVDYEALSKAGAIMGSGGLIVMDESTCMVDVALYFIQFLVEESCGKCVPCRVGLERMRELLVRITSGNGNMDDLNRLEALAKTVQTGSLCGLGQTAPNPVLTTLRYFREEYESHILRKRCEAGVCKALVRYSINKQKCTGCAGCVAACPVHAINGTLRQPHEIDAALCTKCGACLEACRFGAIDIE